MAYILGIESSCDETAASVTLNGRQVLSDVIFSQADIHKKYGGVVPEIASRNHILSVSQVVEEALKEANIKKEALDAVAVTVQPGLIGALLVGLSMAKGFAYAIDKPLVPVNHLHGHIAANYIAHPSLTPPFICLVASGGHSHVVEVTDYNRFTVLGATMDDAAGEAFDKVARVLGLGYPGGPKVSA
ncbi:MAG: tRNA (adenosine(37)-N6)-threonylcarbamoyltransferase complex transferase subunit TsaD, partial [Clostridia bacterium]|nr:tRNA (adenosine(37)-N6)-threonylcarbamoyltransferase complex transferase subunit TsaD [Clostridia bacterium]